MTRTPTAARTPEEITSLVVERVNAGDPDGVAALYEPEAVLAYPLGREVRGRAAIRDAWARLIAGGMRLTPEPPLPTARVGDLALTSTPPRDGAGARAQVVRRQSDGTWLRLIDVPEFTATGPGA
ncbi:MAG: nuclear transport factor 2 family protein [Thermoleophilia bacterium]